MKTTKAKINSVLEKKLEELESLREAISINEDDDPNVYRDIELRVIFAKTLLAAEISSRPIDIEGEEVSEERLKLACMAKKLNELEEVFKANQFSGHDNGSVTEQETGSMETYDGDADGEAGSVYSLVESCLNEVGKTEKEEEEEQEEDAEHGPFFQDASSEEKKEVTFPIEVGITEKEEEEEETEEEGAEQWPLFQDTSSEEKKEVTFPAEEEEEDLEVVVREVQKKRRLCFRALVCFGLIGLVGGMTSLLGDDMKEDVFLLTPT